jgi:hypothetical protein
VVDAAWYEELRGQLFSLLIMVEDRLGRDQARWVHHVIDVDEYGLALEDMVGILAHAKAPVTDQKRAEMLALALKMHMDDLVSRLLHCPSAGPASAAGDDGTTRA